MVWRILKIAVLAAVLLVASLSCRPQADSPVGREFTDSLLLMNATVISTLQSEVGEADKRLYALELKLQKLEQVMVPAREWIEYQKSLEQKTGSWVISVSPQALEQLKNDQYRIAKLSLLVKQAGEQFLAEIKVIDLADNKTADSEAFASDLKLWKGVFQEQREQKLKSKQLAISTMENVLASKGDRTMNKVSGSTYSISGPGLGWANGLTRGKWTYNRDTKEATPADQAAVDLKGIITAK